MIVLNTNFKLKYYLKGRKYWSIFFPEISVYRNVNAVPRHVLALLQPIISWNTKKELPLAKCKRM